MKREPRLQEKEPRSLRVSTFLMQIRLVEYEIESEGLPRDRSSPHLRVREIMVTINGSQLKKDVELEKVTK